MAERLKLSHVAIVGVGGLGNPVAMYLATQGVGRLTLVDPDIVEPHNLGRQVLFTPDDIGRKKVEAARDALVRLAPSISVHIVGQALTEQNMDGLLASVDLVVDGLDRGEPREWLNRYSVVTGVPVVFGGAIGYEAQVFVVRGGRPCLFCLFGAVNEAAEDCAVSGVLGPVVGMAGTVQAQEALKLLLGVGDLLIGRIWTYDAYSGTTRVLAFPPRKDCPVCGGYDSDHA